MKKLKNILIQFAISFTVLWSVFVWYAAWNDVVSDGSSLTHTMWNDLVTQVSTVTLDVPPVLKWYISWLTLSNDSGDVNNDIQIEVWTATSSDGLQYIDLATIMTKRLDAGWTAWDNAGWLATWSKASNTSYHVFIIRKSDGSVDAWFDTSTIATNLLSTSGYNKYRRVGSVKTDSSSNIRGFIQTWHYFYLKTPIQDVSGTPTTSATLNSLTVPTGITVQAIINSSIADIGSGVGANFGLLTSPSMNDVAPSSNLYHMYQQRPGGFIDSHIFSGLVLTNVSGQIRSRFSSTLGGFKLVTNGWLDSFTD